MIEVENIPTEPGLYRVNVQFGRRLSVADAQLYFKDAFPKHTLPGGITFGVPVIREAGAGEYKIVMGQNLEDDIRSGDTEFIDFLPGASVAIGDIESKIVTGMVCYVAIATAAPVPPGTNGIYGASLADNGKISRVFDGHGNAYNVASGSVGVLPALASIPPILQAISAMAVIAIAIAGAYYIHKITLVAVEKTKELADRINKNVIQPTAEAIKKGYKNSVRWVGDNVVTPTKKALKSASDNTGKIILGAAVLGALAIAARRNV